MSGQALIDHGRFLEVLGVEGELLAELASAVPPDAPVRTCPGWTPGEVGRHVGSVYRMVLARLEQGREPLAWQRSPDAGQTVSEFVRAAHAELIVEFDRHDPAQRADTWWPADPTYGFWRRRMTHETVIHRTDLRQAAGEEVPQIVPDIPEDVAVDGIDEMLSLWFGQRLPLLGLTGTRQATVALHTGGHTWIARAGPTETIAWRCSAVDADRADATVTGDPASLYLWLWGRAGFDAYDATGTEDAVAQLNALLRLATR